MKSLLYKFLFASALFGAVACEDFETVNTDPNNPIEVPTNMIMAGVQKQIMDNVYDNWFSGRQCLVYTQYWAQRNYTEEDRYQIRESVNNNYFNYLYQSAANLDEIIKLNSDEATASKMVIYGDNNNQIAAAKILKVWLYQLITDTWGNVPYTEASKLLEGVYYPKYDDQQTIYQSLIAELTEAVSLIDESKIAFEGGDRIFDGDASKWKKFANSLKCRLAIHVSKVDPNWKKYIADALASGVFQSNADNALYAYSSTAPEQCGFYIGYFEDGRNDFTITRPFTDILKGQRDTLNSKTHPWEGVTDPRLPIYTTPRNENYIGMPYGIPSSSVTSTMRNMAPNWYSFPPLCLNDNFTVPLMTYAELQFILSEYNGYSVDEYKKGIRASLEYWSKLSGTIISSDSEPLNTAQVNAYITAVSGTVNAETVALQKYIDLYMNGTESWVEYRRTGYPTQLLKPGEISIIDEGVSIPFSTLSDTKGDIISRVKYPTNESTLNGENFNAAITKLQDGTNNYYSKMFWDVRTSANPHPANK